MIVEHIKMIFVAMLCVQEIALNLEEFSTIEGKWLPVKEELIPFLSKVERI